VKVPGREKVEKILEDLSSPPPAVPCSGRAFSYYPQGISLSVDQPFLFETKEEIDRHGIWGRLKTARRSRSALPGYLRLPAAGTFSGANNNGTFSPRQQRKGGDT